MIIDRTKNTINGTIFGIAQKVIALLFPFIIRTIFIWTLGAEYLGLSSLFTSILQVLNLAELGVGTALVFSMYKPIVDNDKAKICALMRLYKRYYNIIGLIVLVAGLAIMPFLPHLISGSIPADINIYVLYLMQLTSTVLTYWLFAYRISIFQAFQRVDIISIIGICVNLVTYLLQIISLLAFRNFYLYLSISIISQILNNIVTALLSKKLYPEFIPRGDLDPNEIKQIHHKVADLFTAKLGGVISNSFDTIVVSAFLGLTTLAIYQNYFYIVTAVSSIIMIFFSALQAGIGNFLITNSKEESAQLFDNLNYIVFFVLNTCCACLITLYQPFMQAWVGERYMLEFPMVVMFAMYLFAYILIRPAIVFKDAAGMWKEDKFRPLTSSLSNLALNLLTVKWLGLYGVLGSTIVSYLFVSLPWVLININKYMFKLNIRKFLLREFMYTIVTLFSCAVCWWICNSIQISNIVGTLAIYLVISLAIPTRIISDKNILNQVLSNQNGNGGFGQEIDKLLLVTSDIRYFNAERETFQAFIDGGMYAESVINSLYYYGIGSIPLSASLNEEQEENVRKILKLEDSEVFILFIGVGNYPDTNQTTRSERKQINVEII